MSFPPFARLHPARLLPLSPLRSPNFAVLLGLAWLAIVAQLLADHWADAARTLSDMDDAMRLVEVREYLAGHGWFNLHEPRLGPPAGYDTHWSRLIDAGIGGLILGFGRITGAATAEWLARILWPVLWLIPTMAGAALLAWRIAGRSAALVVLLFAVLGLPAFAHFVPGRIDHHNVQIALAMLLIAAVAWSDRADFAAAAAGVLTGAAMAIGFESAPFVVLAGAAMALRFVADRNAARSLALYGTGAAVAVAAAFLVNVAPAHWGRTACDAIAVNSAAAAIIGAAALALVAIILGNRSLLFRGSRDAGGSAGWRVRAVAVAAAAAVAGAAFLALEPRCLGGPFAMVDPTVRAIWLDHVSEMQPLWTVAANSAAVGAAVAAFPAVGLLCMLVLARDPSRRRDFGFAVAAVALLIAAGLMTAMVRAFSYAEWLAIPMAAAATLGLASTLRLGSILARAVLVFLLAPAISSAMALAAVQAVTRQGAAPENSRVAAGCLRSESYALLATLPPGLVVTDIDYGPFVLALTPHAVLSAPYHQLTGPIIAAHRIFALPPDAARKVVEEIGPDYLVLCGRHTLGRIGDAERAASLWGRLTEGEIPAWLEPVPASLGQPLMIYRVKP